MKWTLFWVHELRLLLLTFIVGYALELGYMGCVLTGDTLASRNKLWL